MNEPRPLLTFALFSYNQLSYIRESVQAALAQTYSPLEIIISDDFSTDGTFEAVCEEVEKYTGPHRIRLNRMPKNVGVCAHVNFVVALAHGELLVAAAGDDLSLPHRTETIWQAWCASGKVADSLYSAIYLIDAAGEDIGPMADPSPSSPGILEHCRQGLVITGSAHAWSRRVFEAFGPLRDDLVYEDRGIALRSRLLGGIQFIPEILVKYRRTSTSLTGVTDNRFPAQARRRETALHMRRLLFVYRQWEADFEKSSAAPPGWRELIAELKGVAEMILAMVENGFWGRLKAFLVGVKRRLPLKLVLHQYAMYGSRIAYGIWVRLNPKLRESGWEQSIKRLKAAQAKEAATKANAPAGP